MVYLTRRQNDVLTTIKEGIAATGIPPTRAEIALKLGFKSANAAEEHLKTLCRKGVIEIMSGVSRGIRIISTAHEEEGLPVIGKVAAGQPVLAIEHIQRYCAVPATFFHPNADYLLTVQGDSMKDVGIMDGDLLAVHKQPAAENGQIVVARIDDEITVKRLKRTEKALLLLPENDAYEPITITNGTTDFTIEGIYVGIIRC